MNAQVDISDTILGKRIRNGDQTAFELIFKRYYASLLVFAIHVVQDKDVAEELVQSLFVTLWERRSKLEITSSVRSYLFASIRNLSFNYLKHKKIESEVLLKMQQAVESHPVFNENIYELSDLACVIKEYVGTLPERCREVFILSRFDGLSNEEISEKLQISRRTVEKHISNALLHLKKSLPGMAAFLLPLLH